MKIFFLIFWQKILGRFSFLAVFPKRGGLGRTSENLEKKKKKVRYLMRLIGSNFFTYNIFFFFSTEIMGELWLFIYDIKVAPPPLFFYFLFIFRLALWTTSIFYAESNALIYLSWIGLVYEIKFDIGVKFPCFSRIFDFFLYNLRFFTENIKKKCYKN